MYTLHYYIVVSFQLHCRQFRLKFLLCMHFKIEVIFFTTNAFTITFTGCTNNLEIILGISIPLTFFIATIISSFLTMLFLSCLRVHGKHKKMNSNRAKDATQIFTNEAYGKHRKHTKTMPQSSDTYGEHYCWTTQGHWLPYISARLSLHSHSYALINLCM